MAKFIDSRPVKPRPKTPCLQDLECVDHRLGDLAQDYWTTFPVEKNPEETP